MIEYPCMDNNRLVVVSETRKDFELAMQLAFRHNETALGWWFYEPKTTEDYPNDWSCSPLKLLGVPKQKFLVLGWRESSSCSNFNAFPCHIDCETATEFAWAWLNKQEYNDEPDHDGSNGHGFVIFNESWGMVGNEHAAICAIGVAWAMRGK